MAMIKTTRKGFLGFRRTRVEGPSSNGTKAAFAAGEDAFKKTGGATPGLKRMVAMHLANTAAPQG